MSLALALARGFGVAEQKVVEFSPELWAAINGGAGLPTAAGSTVSTLSALQQATFWRCVLVIAEGVAMLPVEIYRSTRSGKGSEPAVDHPLYDLLRWQPSANQDSFQFWLTVLMHAAASGDSVSYRNLVRGQVAELLPFRPENVQIDADNRFMVPEYSCSFENGEWRKLGRRDVFHISGPQWWPFKGMNPASLGKEAIGLARATEETHARLHANGARPSGALQTDKALSPAQIERLREQWRQYSGVANTGKTLLLEGGVKWEPITMKGVDAEHVATRKHQIEEICRLMGVFPIMVGHAGDQSPTFASSSEFFAAHVRYTLLPWIRRVIGAVTTQLLTKQERKEGYSVRVDTAEFLRGSLKDRAEYYRAALGSNSNPGWLKVNEIREDDGWDPDADPSADKLWQPQTMQNPAQPAAQDAVEPLQPADGTKKSRPRTLYVARYVKNSRELMKWAREQGIPNLVAAEDLHVTIAHSRSRIDWMDIDAPWDGELLIAAGGPRVVEFMGADKKAVALLFRSDSLSYRHAIIRDAGASWDWPDYQPHITLSYDAQGFNADDAQPFTGPLRLGPEIFAEIDR